MPELPEVEVVVLNLREWLVGRAIRKLVVRDRSLLQVSSPATWSRRVKGRRCSAVERRAKYILIRLEDCQTIIAHLAMTGKIVKLADDEKPERSRLLFVQDNGSRLSFKDLRRFGKAWLLRDSEVATMPELSQLGPDPLLDGLTGRYLSDVFARTRRPMKLVLMDQRVIGGLGNILASEILFEAGVSPRKRADRLTKTQIDQLRRLIPKVCRRVIRKQRSPEVHYLGESGSVNHFRVYRREGEPCPKCGARIKRTTQAQRSTYFCQACQKSRPGGRGPDT